MWDGHNINSLSDIGCIPFMKRPVKWGNSSFTSPIGMEESEAIDFLSKWIDLKNYICLSSMDYVNYSVEDFVLDQYFKAWVLHYPGAQIAFWELWIAKHPEKCKEIKEARKIIMVLHNLISSDDNEEQESRWQKTCN